MAPRPAHMASATAPAKNIADRIFISFYWSPGRVALQLKTLADSEARVRSIHSFGEVDAYRTKTELGYVETDAEAGIPIKRPISGISGDAVRVRVEKRVRASDVVIQLVDEDRERNTAI